MADLPPAAVKVAAEMGSMKRGAGALFTDSSRDRDRSRPRT
jgi:hypothetical protein